MKSGILAIGLMVLGSAPVLAEDDRGLYIGAGVGQFNVEIDDIEDVGETVGSFDSDDTTFKIFAGWRFNKFIGIEVDYIDLGAPEDTVNDLRVKAEINGIAPYLIGAVPLGAVELFAKVGYYFYDVKINAESIGTLDDSSEDFVYGAGVGITLFEHLHARLEYEIIDVSEVDDANALWLSGAWRF